MVGLLVGTVKGLFTVEGEGSKWDVSGPDLQGWEVSALGTDGAGGPLVGSTSGWYGTALHRPGPEGWEQLVAGPSYPEGGDRKLVRIWTIDALDGEIWVGVDNAGLFRSADGGGTWAEVPGLNDHPTREGWFPGGGGLCAHRLLADPADGQRMWVGISAVGVFRSDDGGETWVPKNQGIEWAAPDERWPDIGYCVHGLAIDPGNTELLWRQDHSGVYRSEDGADHWERIENGLPARFGFPIWRDDPSGRLFLAPMQSDEFRVPPGGRLEIYRSEDGGDTWVPSGKGLPEHPVFAGVLRRAMTGDGQGGVFFGTIAGTLHASEDAGETWVNVDAALPRILAVQVV